MPTFAFLGLFPLVIYGIYNLAFLINKHFFRNYKNSIVNILIFFSIISFYYLIAIYGLIIDINLKIIIKSSIVFFLSLGFIFLIKNFKLLQFKKIFSNKSNSLIFLIIFIFYINSFSSPVDLDSMRYHLEISKKILQNNFFNNITLDYVFIGANEFINYVGLLFNFENLSSTLSVACLVFAFLANQYFYEKFKVGTKGFNIILILSCPYLIGHLSSQKLFFLPSFLSVLAIIYIINKKDKLEILEVILISLVSIFCLAIKSNFIFLSFFIFILLFYYLKNFKYRILLFFINLILFIIYIFPLFYIKLKIFNDPFLPFFSINAENALWFSKWKNYVLSYDNPINLKNLFILPINILMPFEPKEIFKILGFGMLAIFFINYKKKNIVLITVAYLIFIVLITQNIQFRWFVPLFIFGTLLYSYKNKYHYIFKKIIFIQLLCCISAMSIYMYFSFPSMLSESKKEEYLNKFAYGYPAVKFIEKNYKDHTIITREENFYLLKNNYIPIFKYEIQKMNKNLFFNTSKLKNNNILIVVNLKSNKKLKDGGQEGIEIDHILKNDNICLRHKFYKKFNTTGRSFYTSVSAQDNYLFIEGIKSDSKC